MALWSDEDDAAIWSSSDDSDNSDDEMAFPFDQIRAMAWNAMAVGARLVTQLVTPNVVLRPRRMQINRDRKAAHDRLVADYFCENPKYPPERFERRFRMSKALFLRIVNDLEAAFPFFQLSWDARGRRGFTSLQKCTAAIRQLAYGTASDIWEEYLEMSEKTIRQSMYNFCKGVITLYSPEYLRAPNAADVQRIYAFHNTRHGFPGMLGSLDCTHWTWAACPVAWRAQFMRGDHPAPSVMLEAAMSQDLRVWHAYFGPPGSMNDINVLNQSPLFNSVKKGTAPHAPITVNNVVYRFGYYLVDGIYPELANFVKSFTCPIDDKRKYFKRRQEGARKDVERGFGVFKQKWHIIHLPARSRKVSKLSYIMYACLTMHNMILEDQGDAVYPWEQDGEIPAPVGPEMYNANVMAILDRQVHSNLRADLIEHLWNNRQV